MTRLLGPATIGVCVAIFPGDAHPRQIATLAEGGDVPSIRFRSGFGVAHEPDLALWALVGNTFPVTERLVIRGHSLRSLIAWL